MDRITTSFVKEFAENHGLQHESESTKFEHFVNYSIVSGVYHDTFDPLDVNVGGNGTPGIDGLAILVNGALIEEEQEVEDLLKLNKSLDVSLYFVQAKTSSHFDCGDISGFVQSVRALFCEEERCIQRSESLAKKMDIVDSILDKTSSMKRSPLISLYYVTTGQWEEPELAVSRFQQGKNDLMSTQLFSDVRMNPLGAREIQKLYRSSKSAIEKEVNFPNKVSLPELTRVSQAFIGVLPVSTLFELVVDENENLRSSVFEENIRAFQGGTAVNEGMADTLRESPESFVVRNNGITIVCRELRQTGSKCSISDYQIVNGCQTTNVLFNARRSFDPERVFVPVKLIATDDDEFVNSVIRSTNSQNAVKAEQLEAMTDFQKNLERFFATHDGEGRLYYERRSKQWATEKVEKTRVVTICNQIKSYVSMFMNEPHRVSGYYGTVRERLSGRIFSRQHSLYPYYTSALALYRLDSLFRSGLVDPKYKKVKWFLLMAFRRYVSGNVSGGCENKKAIEKQCEKLIRILTSQNDSQEIFGLVVSNLFECSGPIEIGKDTPKTQGLRDRVLEMTDDL